MPTFILHVRTWRPWEVVGHRPSAELGLDTGVFSFQPPAWAAPQSKVWRRSRWGDTWSWPLLCCGAQTVREAGRERPRDSGEPYREVLWRPETSSATRTFPWFPEDPARRGWVRFWGLSYQRVGGKTAGYLQGLTWNFTFHIKLVNFTRGSLFEVYVMLAMDQATMTSECCGVF